MVENKYGKFTNEQFEEFKKRLHGQIHWLLVYEDEKNPILDSYFQIVQEKLAGLNSLLNFPSQIVEMMNLVESARIEYQDKENHNHKRYRKIILDIHDLVDKIGDLDE